MEGRGGVVIAPAVVAKIAHPAPAFAVGRSGAASRPPCRGVRRPVESPWRLLPSLPRTSAHPLPPRGNWPARPWRRWVRVRSERRLPTTLLTQTWWPWRPPPLSEIYPIGKKNISVQLGLVRVDFTQRTIKKHVYSLRKHTFCQHALWSAAHGTSSYNKEWVIITLKNCIAVLRRLCITVRCWAIALTYYFEAAGTMTAGGDHGVCFLMCAACVVCCVVHEVFFYVCCLCWLLCCAARSDNWIIFLSTSLELGCSTVGLMGLKHIHT